MTLDKTPRYDPERVEEQGDTAIVLGASMAGLLAARILADAYDSVIIIERDDLPDQPVPRSGVPQGYHVHVLLEAGRATITDLFPGYGEDLIDGGALIINVGKEQRHYEKGDYITAPATRMELYCASRPLIETTVRNHLTEMDGLTIRSNSQFTEYKTDATNNSVEGVRVRDGGDETTLDADLVVDATGRASRTPRWLSNNGYQKPPVEEVSIDFEYSSIRLERPSDDRRMIFAPQSPPRTHAGAVFPIENDEWLVTLGGMHDTTPPSDPEGFEEYATQLPAEEIREIIANHDRVSDSVDQYPFPSNRRHYYSALDRFPGGLVVLGDAVASFNPIYGQGMSVASLEALALHQTLASNNDTTIGRRFFDTAEELIDVAWSMAIGADIAFEQTTGPAPRGAHLFGRYLSRLIEQAHNDPELSETFYRVLGMETSPATLLNPQTVWRTVRP